MRGITLLGHFASHSHFTKLGLNDNYVYVIVEWSLPECLISYQLQFRLGCVKKPSASYTNVDTLKSNICTKSQRTIMALITASPRPKLRGL